MSDNNNAEIICVVLQNETILIGELVYGSLDEEIVTLKECGAVIATSSENAEEGEPDSFFIRDFLGQLVDEDRCFTFRSENLIMVFYPPEVAIEAYDQWKNSESEGFILDGGDDNGELSDSEVSNSNGDNNVVHFNPSDEI